MVLPKLCRPSAHQFCTRHANRHPGLRLNASRYQISDLQYIQRVPLLAWKRVELIQLLLRFADGLPDASNAKS